MGVYASSAIDVSIPAANVPVLAQALRDWIANDTYYKSGYDLPESDEELIGTILVEAEGCEEAPEYAVEPDGSLHITGSYYGKISYEYVAVESIYATNGAVGVIEVECEGGYTRTRLKDGRATSFVGMIVYPEDTED